MTIGDKGHEILIWTPHVQQFHTSLPAVVGFSHPHIPHAAAVGASMGGKADGRGAVKMLGILLGIMLGLLPGVPEI